MIPKSPGRRFQDALARLGQTERQILETESGFRQLSREEQSRLAELRQAEGELPFQAPKPQVNQ